MTFQVGKYQVTLQWPIKVEEMVPSGVYVHEMDITHVPPPDDDPIVSVVASQEEFEQVYGKPQKRDEHGE